MIHLVFFSVSDSKIQRLKVCRNSNKFDPYFDITENETKIIKENKDRTQIRNKSIAKQKMASVINLSETIEQELASRKFLEENSSFVFVGKTNKNNLIFENNKKQIKISPDGFIL